MEDGDAKNLEMVLRGMWEELGFERKDALPLDDRGHNGAIPATTVKLPHPKDAGVARWQNHQFNDLTEEDQSIDNIADGHLARSRRQEAEASHRGGRGGSTARGFADRGNHFTNSSHRGRGHHPSSSSGGGHRGRGSGRGGLMSSGDARQSDSTLPKFYHMPSYGVGTASHTQKAIAALDQATRKPAPNARAHQNMDLSGNAVDSYFDNLLSHKRPSKAAPVTMSTVAPAVSARIPMFADRSTAPAANLNNTVPAAKSHLNSSTDASSRGAPPSTGSTIDVSTQSASPSANSTIGAASLGAESTIQSNGDPVVIEKVVRAQRNGSDFLVVKARLRMEGTAIKLQLFREDSPIFDHSLTHENSYVLCQRELSVSDGRDIIVVQFPMPHVAAEFCDHMRSFVQSDPGDELLVDVSETTIPSAQNSSREDNLGFVTDMTGVVPIKNPLIAIVFDKLNINGWSREAILVAAEPVARELLMQLDLFNVLTTEQVNTYCKTAANAVLQRALDQSLVHEIKPARHQKRTYSVSEMEYLREKAYIGPDQLSTAADLKLTSRKPNSFNQAENIDPALRDTLLSTISTKPPPASIVSKHTPSASQNSIVESFSALKLASPVKSTSPVRSTKVSVQKSILSVSNNAEEMRKANIGGLSLSQWSTPAASFPNTSSSRPPLSPRKRNEQLSRPRR